MRNRRHIETIGIAVAFASVVFAGPVLAGSTESQADGTAVSRPYGLLAQVRTPPIRVPPIRPPNPLPTPTSGGLTPIPTPTPTPTFAPPQMVAPSPPPVTEDRTAPVVPCVVTGVGDLPPGNCQRRYIRYSDLYRDFYACNDARCYARKLLSVDQVPTVVIYPEVHSARVQAQDDFRSDVMQGVEQMGAYLEQRAYAGEAGLPSISSLRSLVSDAKREIANIDQPIDESPDQWRRRLGIGNAMRLLARYTRDH